MADECLGKWMLTRRVTKRHGQTVNEQPEDDGRLILSKAVAAGAITGTHTQADHGVEDIDCTDSNPHRIHFKRDHHAQPGIKFVYDGTLHADGFSMGGNFRIDSSGHSAVHNPQPKHATNAILDTLDPGDGGTWQGTRPPVPDDGDDEQGDDGQSEKPGKAGGGSRPGYGSKAYS